MNTKLIIGSILCLLLLGAANSNAYPLNYGPGGVVCYGGGGYGYGGGGNGSYSRTVSSPGYSSSTTANYSAPYGNAYNNQAVLGGIAQIIGAATPIIQQALVNQQQQQQPVVYIIQAK
jgi:hypothetical protein